MNEFCNECPVVNAQLREEQISEATRLITFELMEHELKRNGQWNRFIDGVFFDRPGHKLSKEQKAAAYACVAKQICGECVTFAQQ